MKDGSILIENIKRGGKVYIDIDGLILLMMEDKVQPLQNEIDYKEYIDSLIRRMMKFKTQP